MGCSTMTPMLEEKDFRQESLILDQTDNIAGLHHAQSLINLITRIRNKIIYLYHKLIYSSGACLYVKPNIILVLKCILYKISSEFQGHLQNSGITYKEDPPYLKIDPSIIISKESMELLNELFSFITELVSYKTIIKQIDKETPELLYLIFENNEKLSKQNYKSINRGIDLFKDLIKIRYDILSIFKNQIYEFIQRKETFCSEIDKIGKKAYDSQITDIYEIVMLNYKNENDDSKRKKNPMYKSITKGKEVMQEILNEENDSEIINENDSIIENIYVNKELKTDTQTI